MENIVEVFAAFMNNNVDSKTMTYWTQAIKNGHCTVDDLKACLFKSEEYRTHVETMFKQIYFELVGFEEFDHVFAEFWSGLQVGEVTYTQIEEFVRKSKEYTAKVKAMIISSFEFNRKPYDDSAVHFYIDKFMNAKGIDSYTLDSLQKDITNDAHLATVDLTANNNIKSEEAEVCAFDGIIDTHNALDTNYNEFSLPTSQIKKNIQVTFNTECDNVKLEAFEHVFQRPMYVQEYFKYVVSKVNNIVFDDLEGLHNQHVQNYHKTARIYADYKNSSITEWKYIREFLTQVDDDNFFINLVEDIVLNNPEYKRSMYDVINIWYKKLYDSNLVDEELECIYKLIQAKKLSLNDEAVVTEIKQFKNETDSYIEAIFDKYNCTLNRQPDITETDNYVRLFREQVPQFGINTVATKLENELMQTLEFHDILKLMIKTRFVSKNQREIVPSKLFNILQTLTRQITHETTMTSIDALFDTVDL